LAKGAQLNAVADNGTTPLINACKFCASPVALFYIEQGANVNAQALYTPLQYACYYNMEQVALLLLEKGANVNPDNSELPEDVLINTGSPLYGAIKNCNEKLVKILLSKGADPNNGIYNVCWAKNLQVKSDFLTLTFFISLLDSKQRHFTKPLLFSDQIWLIYYLTVVQIWKKLTMPYVIPDWSLFFDVIVVDELYFLTVNFFCLKNI